MGALVDAQASVFAVVELVVVDVVVDVDKRQVKRQQKTNSGVCEEITAGQQKKPQVDSKERVVAGQGKGKAGKEEEEEEEEGGVEVLKVSDQKGFQSYLHKYC